MTAGAYFTRWWQTRREPMLAAMRELWTPGDDIPETLVATDGEKGIIESYPNDFVKVFETTVGYIIATCQYDKQNLARAEALAVVGDLDEAARIRAAFPDAAIDDTFTGAFVPALVVAGKAQAPIAAKIWGATGFPRFLVGLAFATADQRSGRASEDAFAEFLPAAPARFKHLVRSDGTINPDIVDGDMVTRGEGRTRQDSLDDDSYFDSLHPPGKPGAKPGSHHAKKREPLLPNGECERAVAMWTEEEVDRTLARIADPALRSAAWTVQAIRVYRKMYPDDHSATEGEMCSRIRELLKRGRRLLGLPPEDNLEDTAR